jgi:arylformamidase
MSEWIDITRTLSNDMITWPGDPPFRWWRVSTITGPESCNLSEIQTGVHAGTHIDAPLHFIPEGMDVCDIALSSLCGRACVVEVTEPRDAQADDLIAAGVSQGERVLLKTRNEQRWAQGQFDENYHGISEQAARWMVEHEVPLVGIDYLSADGYTVEGHPAHYVLLGNGIPILESLDLSTIAPGRYEMIALPLKIAGSEGSPVRAILRRLN